MSKPPVFPLFFVFLLFVISEPVSASFIRLNTTVFPKVENNRLKVAISALNKGDESAFNVQAEVLAGGKKILAAKQPELGINSTYKASVTAKLDYKTPGLYPMVVIMHYTDANQYPFSALNGQSFNYHGGAAPSEIFGQIKSTAFWKEGELKLILKNIGTAAIKSQVRLIAPRELTIDEKPRAIEIAPKSEAGFTFPAKNFSALSGSTYQIFAVCEYEKDGLHYTSFFPGTIKIVASQELFGLSYPVIFILLAILIFIFIGAQFFLKGSSRE